MNKQPQFKIFKRSRVMGRPVYFIIDETTDTIIFESHDPVEVEKEAERRNINISTLETRVG